MVQEDLGKLHFFGVWADPDAAHQNYLRIAEDLHAGRDPSPAAEGEFTVKQLGNQFLAYEMQRVETGQIGGRRFEDCRRVVRQFARSIGPARPVKSLTALYGASVLYPAPLRDLLMHLAGTDLFRARWTTEIHEEWMRSLRAIAPTWPANAWNGRARAGKHASPSEGDPEVLLAAGLAFSHAARLPPTSRIDVIGARPKPPSCGPALGAAPPALVAATEPDCGRGAVYR